MLKIGDEIKAQIYGVLHSRAAKKVLPRVPFMREVYSGWSWRHPFDREYGIDTSGFASVAAIQPDAATGRIMECYAGSQPGIVRRVLASLPDKSEHTFVDLGCGKGRVLVVASELNFKEVVGIDVSDALLARARANVAVIRARYPGRSPIRLVRGNAFKFMPESDRLVFYLYNPFGREGVEELVEALEEKVIQENAQIFVVYCNPVWSGILDRSPYLARWSASTIPYDKSEIGYGPDLADTVVVWQSLPARYDSLPGARRRVILPTPTHAELETPLVS
jgi:SAM-dependent methyltransferase